jgi:hypothetical protein
VRALLIAVTVFMLLGELAIAQKVISPAPNASAPAPLQPPSPGAGNPNSPTQAKPAGADKSAEPDQRGTQESPLIVKIFPTQQTEAETRQAEEERENKSTPDWWMVRFTAILGFIGFLQLLAFGWQGWQLRRGVSVAAQAANEARDAIKATQASADAANTHAAAAEEANRINRDLLIATQRPWIFAESMAPAGPLEYTGGGVRLRITCTLKNIGRAPAIYVWPRVCGVLQQSSEYNRIRQLALISEAEQDQSIARQFGHAIFPGQEIPVDAGIFISDSEIAMFQQPNFERVLLQITIIGFIKYQFTFDVTWRYTGFSYRVRRTDFDGITGTGTHPTFYKDAGDIAAKDLTLRPWFADGECFFAT